MISKEKRLILDLIRIAVFQKKVNLNDTEDIDFNYVYKIAKKHLILNIIHKGIKDCNLAIPDEIRKKFDYDAFKATEKYAIMAAEEEYLIGELEKHNIKYMPLKGMVIRNLYPSPELRASVDLDIFFDEKDKAVVNEILLNAGYEYIRTTMKDIIYHKEPVMNIEMHFRLIGESEYNSYFDSAEVWKRAVPIEESKNRFMMSHEDNYIFMIYHIAKHYKIGGCGIRSIIDLYLFLSAYRDTLDKKYIEKVLKNQGYLEFSKHLEKLSLVWFENETGSHVTDDLTNYIFFNEAFGSRETNSLSNIALNYKSGNLNKLFFILDRMFLKPSLLKNRYPVLRKLPVLYPLFLVIRIIDALLYRRKRVKIDFAAINHPEAEYFRKHFSEIGLKTKE